MNIEYWSNIEDDLLKQLYLNKKSKSEVLGAFPNRSYGAIKHRARFLKIKKTHLQFKNENFFEIPNIINCSVAGTIASDGNVQTPSKKNGYRIIIGLSQKDEILLQQILNITKSNCNILRQKVNRKLLGSKSHRVKNPQFKDYFSSTITFSNAQKWIQDLQKHWNITENKSLTLTAPNIIDLDLSLTYILGLINGDGTIGLQKTLNKNYLYIRLLGTKNLMEWVKNRFEEFLKGSIEGTVHLEREGGNVYCFQVNGIQAIKLFEKMDSLPDVIKLARKWQNPEIFKVIEDFKQNNPTLFIQNVPQVI